MKTIFLSFSLKKSSVSEFFVELANQMNPKNKVFILTYGNTLNDFEFSPEIKILKWPSERPTGFSDFYFLTNLVIKYRPDIMISNFGAVNMFLMVGFLFRVPNRIAWYRTLAAQLENKRILKFRKKLFYKLSTEIIANSSATQRDLIINFDVNPGKIKVVYNAVKDPEIYNKVISNKIVYVGRMDLIKGVSILIEAIPCVLKEFPLTEFVFIGGNLRGDAISVFKRQVDTLNIEKNVRFKGNMGKKDVLKEFSTAYLTVVPSIVEAFGYVVIESFSVRTPVIGSDTTGISEIIRDGVDGLLFKPKDSKDLSNKLKKVLRDEDLRNALSRNCYERFKQKFEVETVVNSFVQSLENEY